MRHLLILLTIAFTVFGCRKDKGSNAVVLEPTANADSMPVCDSNNAKQALWLAEEEKLVFCNNGSWDDVKLKANSINAKDVVLGDDSLGLAEGEATTGRLTSTNLQDALSNEIAVDLTTSIADSTWDIANVGSPKTSENIAYASAGIVEFSGSSVNILEGDAAFLGVTSNNCNGRIKNLSMTFEVLDGLLLITQNYSAADGFNHYSFTRPMQVIIKDVNTLMVLGTGVCGPQNGTNVSILTRRS